MKIIFALLSISFALAAYGQPLRPPEAKPSRSTGAVVITVGSNKIQKQQIDTLVEMMIRARQAQGAPSAGPKPELEKMVATNLIGQELLELEAKRLSLKVEEKEIDSLYRTFKANFPDDKAFRSALKAAGDSEQSLREKIAKQIRSDKLINGQIPKVDRPALKEIQDYYAKHKATFPVNDSLRACQILLMAGKGVSADEASKKKAALENLRADLAKDTGDVDMLLTRFVMAARDASDGPEKKDGGDLQRFHPGDFSPEFKKQVTPLKVGQMSPVFRTPLGWHLVLLTERYDGKPESYRMQIARMLVSAKAADAGKSLRKYLQGLASRYPVKYLEKSYRDTSATGVYNL